MIQKPCEKVGICPQDSTCIPTSDDLNRYSCECRTKNFTVNTRFSHFLIVNDKSYDLNYRIEYCDDVDECLNAIEACGGDKNKVCTNTRGAFFCQCKSGFKEDQH